MPSSPAITLLVPCYNAARFLPRLADCVRKLTVPFADVLCYDDGSTDDTVAVARRLGWRILTPNTNVGVARARNRMVEVATGEWLHFHDADDLIEPRFVEALAPFCDAAHDVVSCDADWVNESDGALQTSRRYDPVWMARTPHAHLIRHAMGLNSSIFRRSAWQRIGGCNEQLAIWEDADVHIRLARTGARWHHVPEVLTKSLRRSESFSHDHRLSWQCRLIALEGYATHASVSSVREELIIETERAGAQLAVLGEDSAAQRAIALCRQLGGNPPTSRHPAIRLLKPLVPTLTLLRWQERRRQGT